MAKILIGQYEGSIYPDGNGYRGAIDLGLDAKGKRQRVKRRAKTKTLVKDKLREAVADLEVPRGFRTVHQLGWTIWKGEVFAPT